MVKIERPEADIWKAITVEREGESVELRFVYKAGTEEARATSDRFNTLTTSEARCAACLLLAAAEHPTEGQIDIERDNPDGPPMIVRREPSGPVELRLRRNGAYAEMSPATARRIAHALMAESQ